MVNVFNPEKLSQVSDLSPDYLQADPFPHIVMDNVIDIQVLQAALDAFPQAHALDFYRYDNELEKKLAFDQVSLLPVPLSTLLHTLNMPLFLRFLEELTGIEGLIPDPYYRGGGIHQIEMGGKLDVHIDFNKYTKLNLYRRLNVIIYLNQEWQEEYGGHLELWRGHKEGETHVLDECVSRILPLFNRMVVFSTSDHSYHGHPDPVTCPKDRSRKSLATYYYTQHCPEGENAEPHSTIFVRRPTDAHDPYLEELRKKRNKGRLASNVTSHLVAE